VGGLGGGGGGGGGGGARRRSRFDAVGAVVMLTRTQQLDQRPLHHLRCAAQRCTSHPISTALVFQTSPPAPTHPPPKKNQMYYRGKMFGFVHLYSGQEAVSSGVIKLLRPDDKVCSTYRDHVHALSKGVPAREIMAELFGKATGCCRGQGGSMHIFSQKHGVLGGYAFIGEGIPVGVGAAFSAAYK